MNYARYLQNITAIIIFTVTIGTPSITRGQQQSSESKIEQSKEGEILIGLGVLLPGTVLIDGGTSVERDSTTSILAQLIYDDFSTSNASVGFYLNVGSVCMEYYEDPLSLFEGGITIRKKMKFEDKNLKAGVGLGYRMFSHSSLSGVTGLGLNAQAELQLGDPGQEHNIPYIGVGFLTQLTGGNDDYWITFGPILMLVGGVTL